MEISVPNKIQIAIWENISPKFVVKMSNNLEINPISKPKHNMVNGFSILFLIYDITPYPDFMKPYLMMTGFPSASGRRSIIKIVLFLFVIVLTLFFDTGSDGKTYQHTEGDADAGIISKGSADGCAKTHSQAHTLCPTRIPYTLAMLSAKIPDKP